MSKRGKIAVTGVAVGLLLAALTNFWFALLVMVGVPAVAYLLLDPAQRRRVRQATRKQLGS